MLVLFSKIHKYWFVMDNFNTINYIYIVNNPHTKTISNHGFWQLAPISLLTMSKIQFKVANVSYSRDTFVNSKDF